MGFLDKLFRKQKQYLDTDEHFRAFSPDPDADYYQLAGKGDNSEAISSLKAGFVTLQHVATGTVERLSSLSQSNVIFVTLWEPYSAQSIGAIKRKLDASDISNCKFVFFEENAAGVKESKSESWYFDLAYVVHADSNEFKKLIGRVPFIVVTDSEGNVTDTSTCFIK